MGPGLKTLGCYHNPQSADLGGRWMVSEGYSPMRGGVPVFSISAAGPGKLLGPGRVKNSKNAPVLIGS